MNKTEFLKELQIGLKKKSIKDIEDIITDYEVHFENEQNKGRTEEETVVLLGDLTDIIDAYEQGSGKPKPVKGLAILLLSQLIWLPVLCLLYAFAIVLLGAGLSSVLLGLYYLLLLDFLTFLPTIALPLSFLYAVMLLFGGYFFYRITMIYCDAIRTASSYVYALQRTELSGVKHAGMNKFDKNRLKLAKYASIIFFGLFLVLIITSMIVARSIEFWHHWNWFGG